MIIITIITIITTINFFFQIELHITMCYSEEIVRCYGITKDPETNNFMMVMKYISSGSLRQHLNRNFNSFSWENKLYHLFQIANGLKKIHEKKLIHHDFHCGNILCKVTFSFITDLGLCKPANVKSSQSGNK